MYEKYCLFAVSELSKQVLDVGLGGRAPLGIFAEKALFCVSIHDRIHLFLDSLLFLSFIFFIFSCGSIISESPSEVCESYPY